MTARLPQTAPATETGTDFTPWPEDFAARYRAAGYWRGEPLGQLLRASAQRWPRQVAIVCGEKRWTYAELDARADQLASGLHQIGLQAGQRVVVQLPNIAEFFVVCFALFRLGAWPVLALPAHRRAEISHFCHFTQASFYIVAQHAGEFDYCALAREVQQQCPALQVIVATGEGATLNTAENFRTLASLYQAPITLPPPDASAVAFLQLSGGSTGLPKFIPRTHDDYFYSVRASAKICGLNPASCYLCVLPAAHNFPLSSPGTLGVLFAGGCIVLTRDASPDACFALIAKERVTFSALVPPLLQVWLQQRVQAPNKFDLSSLQMLQVGGARLSHEVAKQVAPRFGCRLQQVFGMAEGLVNYTRQDDSEELCQQSQGRPISSADEIRIVDDADQDVPIGESGHLLTRGPYTIRGYYRAAAHNAKAFTADGFYRTGDIVRQLPSGHLVVAGRAKDQINRGGEKIAAEEVENHLLAHPLIAGVALVAMLDPQMGERACAFLTPRSNASSVDLRASQLRRFLLERGLAAYKIPDRFECVTDLPCTAAGKIDKRHLRQQLAHLTPSQQESA